MARGDNFNKVARTAATIDPSADRWSDQVLYLLKILTGSDLPSNQQVIVKVDGELPVLVAKLQELKVELLAIKGNTDELEPKLDSVLSAIDNIEPLLSNIFAAIDGIETLINTLNNNAVTINGNIIDVETMAQSIRDRLDDPIDVNATIDTANLAKEVTLQEVKDLFKPLTAQGFTSYTNSATVQTIAADLTRRGLFAFNNSANTSIYLTYDGSTPTAINVADALQPMERRLLSSPTSQIKFIAASPTTIDGYLNITPHF